MVEYRCMKCGAEMASPADLAGQVDICPVCGAECPVPADNVPAQLDEEMSGSAGVDNVPTDTSPVGMSARISARTKWLFLVAGVVVAAAAWGIWVLVGSPTQNTSGPYGMGSGRHYVTDEFCGTWKLSRTTGGTEAFTRNKRAYAQPVTIEKLSAAIDQPEDAATKDFYVIRTRDASGIELDVSRRSADGIHWDDPITQGSDLFTMDGSQLKLTWRMAPSAKPIEVWYDLVTDPGVLSGQAAAADKDVQREYVVALQQIESDELYKSYVSNKSMGKAAEKNTDPEAVRITHHPDVMWKRFKMEVLHAGELIVPGSQPPIRVPDTAYRESLAELLKVAPQYRKQVASVFKQYLDSRLKEMDVVSPGKVAIDKIARLAEEPIRRLDIDEFARIVQKNADGGGNPRVAMRFADELRQYDADGAKSLAAEIQKMAKTQKIEWTPYTSRLSGMFHKSSTDWDKALARRIAPTVLDAISSHSAEELIAPFRNLKGLPKVLCLFLIVSPVFDGSSLDEQDVVLFRTFFTSYAKMLRNHPPKTTVMNNTDSMLWGPFVDSALKHSDKLLGFLLEEVPNNSGLAGILFSRDKLPKADGDRIADAVHRAFVKVVCAHAADVGVTTKKSPTREKDFNDYCRRKWPPSGSAHIHRRIVKRKTSLDNQEYLAFAVAWSTEQMSGSFRWINYGKYGLQSYLKSFPNGKHAAQAKAWVDAK